ncbi:hypothetical protein HU200_022612 [Digitaria exilis]|uniref:Uncharacterized protein n=1 Tax=Digitaria exilis TaxID=1010633 RepID=A0A835CCX1_9POAL|nr:hypothetical protein HU200_022612 [Digitaria exilis]
MHTQSAWQACGRDWVRPEIIRENPRRRSSPPAASPPPYGAAHPRPRTLALVDMQNDELASHPILAVRSPGGRRTRQAHRFRICRALGHQILVDVITTLAPFYRAHLWIDMAAMPVNCTMASKPRVLQDLMKAVDAGHVIDSDKLVMAPPRRSSYYGRGGGRKPPPVDTSSDTSFEFSAVVSYSSASPASMVFSDGQLKAHQFPAVRSSADSSQAPSPARRRSSSASAGSGGGGGGRARAAAPGSKKKRVSFAEDGGAAGKAGGGGQGKKQSGGGLLGCMAAACGASRSQVVDPARNANRKVVAV